MESQPMTIVEAAEILTRVRHRNCVVWQAAGNHVRGYVSSGVCLDEDDFNGFEAVAIARAYLDDERQGVATESRRST
jgi:hypothetical protein